MVEEKSNTPGGEGRERFERLLNENFDDELLIGITYETARPDRDEQFEGKGHT